MEIQDILTSRLFVTLVFTGLWLLLRWMAIKSFTSKEEVSDLKKRKIIIKIKNVSTVVLVIGLFFIWSSELQAMALSLMALAVALVIATKEYLLCLLGGLFRALTHNYRVGDRIELDEFRGDVIDINFLTTTVLEIGPKNLTHQYTGRSVVFPNSMLLSQVVINETYMHKYVLHVFKIPLSSNQDWEQEEERIMKCCMDECQDFIDEAKRYMNKMSAKEGLDIPLVGPRVAFHLDCDLITMVIRIPVPSHQKGRIEQAIIRRYLLAKKYGK